MLLMNRLLLLYGDERSVAVYGCIGYITSIIYLLLQGVGDGSQPLVSRFYGENDVDGVKHTRNSAYKTAAVITVVCMVGIFLARKQIGVLFGASAETNVGVARYLPYFLATLLFLAFVRIMTSYFYATEETVMSYILVYAEPVCTFLLLLILPPVLKLTSVWLAVPLAQMMTFFIGLVESRVAAKRERKLHAAS
ncbi:MAG: MATE family efflux transporter [Candidatus Fimenecus sp.]|nr:MATE family efflux transporter [Candidatus Fimenecus sp.]